MNDYGHMQLTCHCGKPTLRPLEQAICLRGLLRASRNPDNRRSDSGYSPTALLDRINIEYGTTFHHHDTALTFMDAKVEEERTKARTAAHTSPTPDV